MTLSADVSLHHPLAGWYCDQLHAELRNPAVPPRLVAAVNRQHALFRPNLSDPCAHSHTRKLITDTAPHLVRTHICHRLLALTLGWDRKTLKVPD